MIFMIESSSSPERFLVLGVPALIGLFHLDNAIGSLGGRILGLADIVGEVVERYG
jgi:hypothetical protein